jgi:hypothetical protein
MSDIEVQLSVETDSQGEFYVAKPTTSRLVDLSKATILIYHPEDDEGNALMVIKDQDRRHPEELDGEFLKELARAERRFSDGYVGTGFFLKRWKTRSKVFPRSPDVRQKILDRLVAVGQVEVYEVEDDGLKEAIRCTG